jgi:hypothetical protein
MSRMFRPRRPGFSAYFRPHPEDAARAFRRRQELEEKRTLESRRQIEADIGRHKAQATQRKVQEEFHSGHCPHCHFLLSQCQCIDPVFALGGR